MKRSMIDTCGISKHSSIVESGINWRKCFGVRENITLPHVDKVCISCPKWKGKFTRARSVECKGGVQDRLEPLLGQLAALCPGCLQM